MRAFLSSKQLKLKILLEPVIKTINILYTTALEAKPTIMLKNTIITLLLLDNSFLVIN